MVTKIRARIEYRFYNMDHPIPSWCFKKHCQLLEIGNLGKLIEQGYIVLPEQLDQESYGLDDDPDGLNKQDYLGGIWEYRKEVTDLHRDGPKLYAMEAWMQSKRKRIGV
jgi:hypothetical protein